jgi:hypothetical protein
MGIVILAFFLLVGPLALLYGRDSRTDDAGWFGRRR